jgi:hypothetical protein
VCSFESIQKSWDAEGRQTDRVTMVPRDFSQAAKYAALRVVAFSKGVEDGRFVHLHGWRPVTRNRWSGGIARGAEPRRPAEPRPSARGQSFQAFGLG